MPDPAESSKLSANDQPQISERAAGLLYLLTTSDVEYALQFRFAAQHLLLTMCAEARDTLLP